MKNMLLCLVAALALGGCYTQLMTYSAYPGSPVSGDSLAADSGGQAAAGERGRAAAYETYRCDCTPYEIQAGLCWCVCDRCGRFHRFGYEYCPRGYYASYWGWDYYNDFPWWYDRYYQYRHYGYGYPHGYDSSPSGGVPSATLPKADNAPYVGDRKSHRTYIAAPPAAPAGGSTPKANVTEPSQAPSSPAPATQPAPRDTAGSKSERPMNRNRLR